MNVESIRSEIKEIIGRVASIDPGTITDNASFVDDLDLDSLSLLEIGVDVDYAFKLGVPEERLQELRTVQDSVELVLEKFKNRTENLALAGEGS